MCISVVCTTLQCTVQKTQYKFYVWTYDRLPSTGDRFIATAFKSLIQYRHRENACKQVSVKKVGFESMCLCCL